MNKIQKQYKIIENLTKLSAKDMFEELGFKQVLCINQNNSEHAQIKYEAVFANCINVAKECLYVVRPFITTGVRVKYFTCLGIWNLEKIKKLNMKFEENRFFPVQYANQFL